MSDQRRTSWPSLVRQEHPDGCAVASLAMVLGSSFADTLSMLRDLWDTEDVLKHHGLTSTHTDRALAEHGYVIRRVYRSWSENNWPPMPFAPVHLAVVHEPRGHVVVMRSDGTVADPARGERPSLAGYDVQNVTGIWPEPTATEQPTDTCPECGCPDPGVCFDACPQSASRQPTGASDE